MKFNQDMAAKFGGLRRHAALTYDQIKEVYARYHSGETGRSLADEYGVSKSTVFRIASDGHFSDITGAEGGLNPESRRSKIMSSAFKRWQGESA